MGRRRLSLNHRPSHHHASIFAASLPFPVGTFLSPCRFEHLLAGPNLRERRTRPNVLEPLLCPLVAIVRCELVPLSRSLRGRWGADADLIETAFQRQRWKAPLA